MTTTILNISRGKQREKTHRDVSEKTNLLETAQTISHYLHISIPLLYIKDGKCSILGGAVDIKINMWILLVPLILTISKVLSACTPHYIWLLLLVHASGMLYRQVLKKTLDESRVVEPRKSHT